MVSEAPQEGTNAKLVRVLQQLEEHLSALRNESTRTSRDWLTVQDAADELQVSRDTIERLIGSGKIRFSEISTEEGTGLRHVYRIRRDWLHAYLVSNASTETCPTHKRHESVQTSGIDFIGD